MYNVSFSKVQFNSSMFCLQNMMIRIRKIYMERNSTKKCQYNGNENEIKCTQQNVMAP